jgi:hypothetical protein
MVGFTPPGNSSWYPLDRTLGDRCRLEENVLHVPEIELRPASHPVTLPTELSVLLGGRTIVYTVVYCVCVRVCFWLVPGSACRLECVSLSRPENFLSVKRSAFIAKFRRRNVKKRYNLHLFLDCNFRTAPRSNLLTCVYASLKKLSFLITDVHSPPSFV